MKELHARQFRKVSPACYTNDMKTKTNNTVAVPKAAFSKLINAMSVVEDAQEHIEDFLLLSNKKIATDIKRARLEHQKGKVGSWHVLKTRYGI